MNKVEAPPEEVAATPPDLSDPMSAPLCDGVRVLVITASTDPEWSFAALSAGADGSKSSLLRRGSDFNGKTIFFVGWDRVWLQNGNQLCQAQMFRSANAPPPAPPPTPTPAPATGSSNVPPDIAPRLKRFVEGYDTTQHQAAEGDNVRRMEEAGLTEYFFARWGVVGDPPTFVDPPTFLPSVRPRR